MRQRPERAGAPEGARPEGRALRSSAATTASAGNESRLLSRRDGPR